MIYLGLLLWGAIGVTAWGKCVWEDGQMVVDDLKTLMGMIILGPIPIIAVFFSEYQGRVIWKRKPRPTKADREGK